MWTSLLYCSCLVCIHILYWVSMVWTVLWGCLIFFSRVIQKQHCQMVLCLLSLELLGACFTSAFLKDARILSTDHFPYTFTRSITLFMRKKIWNHESQKPVTSYSTYPSTTAWTSPMKTILFINQVPSYGFLTKSVMRLSWGKAFTFFGLGARRVTVLPFFETMTLQNVP